MRRHAILFRNQQGEGRFFEWRGLADDEDEAIARATADLKVAWQALTAGRGTLGLSLPGRVLRRDPVAKEPMAAPFDTQTDWLVSPAMHAQPGPLREDPAGFEDDRDAQQAAVEAFAAHAAARLAVSGERGRFRLSPDMNMKAPAGAKHALLRCEAKLTHRGAGIRSSQPMLQPALVTACLAIMMAKLGRGGIKAEEDYYALTELPTSATLAAAMLARRAISRQDGVLAWLEGMGLSLAANGLRRTH